MAREMIAQSRLCSARGEWKGMSVENKLLCPKGSRLKLGGNIGALIMKCIPAIECLNSKEVPRYFSNSSTHWSPWGPILQLDRLNSLWLETARRLNNKGGKDIAAFWDQGKIEWGGVLETLRDGPLSVDEVICDNPTNP